MRVRIFLRGGLLPIRWSLGTRTVYSVSRARGAARRHPDSEPRSIRFAVRGREGGEGSLARKTSNRARLSSPDCRTLVGILATSFRVLALEREKPGGWRATLALMSSLSHVRFEVFAR